MKLLDAISQALHDDIESNRLGEIYHISDLREGAFAYGVSAEPDEIAQALRENRGLKMHFRGGHGNVRVTLEEPNREATLEYIGDHCYSLDAEAAIQAGGNAGSRTRGTWPNAKCRTVTTRSAKSPSEGRSTICQMNRSHEARTAAI